MRTRSSWDNRRDSSPGSQKQGTCGCDAWNIPTLWQSCVCLTTHYSDVLGSESENEFPTSKRIK